MLTCGLAGVGRLDVWPTIVARRRFGWGQPSGTLFAGRVSGVFEGPVMAALMGLLAVGGLTGVLGTVENWALGTN